MLANHKVKCLELNHRPQETFEALFFCYSYLLHRTFGNIKLELSIEGCFVTRKYSAVERPLSTRKDSWKLFF